MHWLNHVTLLIFVCNVTILAMNKPSVTEICYGHDIIFWNAYPTHSPTNPPTNQPTLSPTGQPTTQTPTTNPIKQSTTTNTTTQPTLSSTFQPSKQPTQDPTDQWDTTSGARRANKQRKQNVKSANSLTDNQLLKQAMSRATSPKTDTHTKSAKKLKHEIKLYDYEIPKELHADHVVQTFQNQLKSNQSSLVIIREFPVTYSNETDVISITSALDSALDQVFYFTTMILQRKFFIEHFELCIYLIVQCDPLIYHNITKQYCDIVDCNSTDIQIKALNEYLLQDCLSMRHDLKRLHVLDLDITQKLLSALLQFTRILFQELLISKLKYLQYLFAQSIYARHRKIPKEYMTIFTKFQQEFSDIIHNQIPSFYEIQFPNDLFTFDKTYILFGDYWSRIELFAYTMQITCAVYEWRQHDKRNQGVISISAGDLSRRNCIDKLLMVIGYAPNVISRYMVVVSINDGDLEFTVIPCCLQDVKVKTHTTSPKIIINTQKKVTKKNKFKLKLLMTTDEVSIVNNPEFDLVIVSSYMALTNAKIKTDRYCIMDPFDMTFDNMCGLMAKYLKDIQSENAQSMQLLVTLFLEFIFEYSIFDKSLFNGLIDNIYVKRFKKFYLIVNIQFDKYQRLKDHDQLKNHSIFRMEYL
eukprot:496832_1